MLRKFIRSHRHTVLVPLASDASVRVRDGDQEVRSRLSIGRLVSHVDEVFPGHRCRPVVDHSTFIDDTNFIEQVVCALRTLVNRHRRRDPGDIGPDAEGLDELEGGRRIQTSG